MFNTNKRLDTKRKLWIEEQNLKARTEVEEYRIECNKEIQKLAIACANDTKVYEHDFHQKREDLGIELAKLEAKKEALVEISNQDKTTYEKMLKHKDGEIERLTTIITTLVGKDPAQITIQNK